MFFWIELTIGYIQFEIIFCKCIYIEWRVTVVFASEVIPQNVVGKVFKLGLCAYNHSVTSMSTSSSINHFPSSS